MGMPMLKLSVYVGLVLCTVLTTRAEAMWIRPDDQVPIERLLANLERQFEAQPDSAAICAQIARVHSLAYAQDKRQFDVACGEWGSRKEKGCKEGEALRLYQRSAGSLRSPRDLPEDLDATRLEHLQASIRYYLKATALDDEPMHPWLGLGYSLHEAARLTERLVWPYEAPFDEQALAAVRRAFEDQAVAAYKKAYEAEGANRGGTDPPVAYEAGSAIVEIMSKREGLDEEQQRELKVIRRKVRQMAGQGNAVTPIIFALDRARPLEELLAPEVKVAFDLDGRGTGATWPWVRPYTYFLVWDGDGKGDVPSGRQLIGSVTWWLFWENGYVVLAALDNDENGWLEGDELQGLAGWCDANSNGVADAGEVLPLAELGVTRLATQATAMASGMPCNLSGLELANGLRLPTYDWVVSPSTVRENAP